MRSGPIQWYALAVCFATLMCFMVALGIAVYDVVELASPERTSGQAVMYASNERYLHYFPNKKSLPPAEVEADRLLEREFAVDSIRASALQSLIFAAIILAIDTVVFGLHWWIAGGLSRSRQPDVPSIPLSPLSVG